MDGHTIIFKDEASEIQVNKVINKIKEENYSLKQALEYVSKVANLDQYAFLIVVKKRILSSGRTGAIVPVDTLSDVLIRAIDKIIERSTFKGNYVKYVNNNTPLFKDYIKRSYVKRIEIDGQLVIIGSGYPLRYV